jgi:queuine tRNA-ribosyltransferase
MLKFKQMEHFRSGKEKIKLPVFFPDATRAVIRTLDSQDIVNTKTPGVLVNTYHLYKDLGKKVVKKHGGIRNFMSWQGGLISDSGGFQIMTLIKAHKNKGSVLDKGVIFHSANKKKVIFTPEKSIRFQMILQPDMVVVLDDFTPPKASYSVAKKTVARTILWAKKSKEEFIRLCEKQKLSKNKRPYLLAVVQGGEYLDLRKKCLEELVEIGFDGLGFGGWPLDQKGNFNIQVAQLLTKYSPKNYLIYGLGIGKPEEILLSCDLGFDIFDCVLPTRDARHKRLYLFNADSIKKINIRKKRFYSYYVPNKEKHYSDKEPVSKACDCLLCQNYSRAYLAHLFRQDEMTAKRLATIHNLRFYSLLMEKIRAETKNLPSLS